MARPSSLTPGWPRLMDAAMAAAYCGCPTIAAFRSLFGVPPLALPIGERFDLKDLDAAIDVLRKARLDGEAERWVAMLDDGAKPPVPRRGGKGRAS